MHRGWGGGEVSKGVMITTTILRCHYLLLHVSSLFYKGPLLYHFADMPNEMSIEIGWKELKEVILKYNFEILVSTKYCCLKS